MEIKNISDNDYDRIRKFEFGPFCAKLKMTCGLSSGQNILPQPINVVIEKV